MPESIDVITMNTFPPTMNSHEMAEKIYEYGHGHTQPDVIAWLAVKTKSFPESFEMVRSRKIGCCQEVYSVIQKVCGKIADTACAPPKKARKAQLHHCNKKVQQELKNHNHAQAFPSVTRRPFVIWKGQIGCFFTRRLYLFASRRGLGDIFLKRLPINGTHRGVIWIFRATVWTMFHVMAKATSNQSHTGVGSRGKLLS